jgi:thiol-disulfide isomerase/thioredoxin
MDKLKKDDKIREYLSSIGKKKIDNIDNIDTDDTDDTYDTDDIDKIKHDSGKSKVELIYFYMNGCHYCDQFNPVWNMFCNKVDSNMIKTHKFSANEMESQDTPHRFVTEYGKDINGFPTILLKLDGKFYMFDKERTVKSLADFIMNKLNRTDRLHKYLEETFLDDDIGKQEGGMKNINYRNKYKKYKQMYAELAIKYNNLKTKLK